MSAPILAQRSIWSASKAPVQGAGTGEVGAQEFHLIGEDMVALQEDEFRVGGGEGHRQQFHARRFRGAARLVGVAAQTAVTRLDQLVWPPWLKGRT